MNILRNKLSLFVLCAVLCFSTFWLTWNISQPWNGLDGSDAVIFSNIARNYLRYGILDIYIGQAVNCEEVTNLLDLTFYQHHPPLFPLLVTLNFSLFGESELATRLVPILSCLGSIILLFVLSRKVYGERVAVIATILFGTFPGILFFGRKPGYEAPALFCILLSLWFYFRLLESRRANHLFGLYLSLGAGLLIDWPVYFVIPPLAVHYLLYAKGAPFRLGVVLGLPLLALVIFGLFQYQSYLVNPGSFKDLLYQGMTYMGLIPHDSPLAAKYVEAQITFTPFQYFRKLSKTFDLFFSYPVLILTLIGFWNVFRKRNLARSLLLFLLAVALANSLFFYRSLFFHPWWIYYFAAPFAILTALSTSAVFSVNNPENPKITDTTLGWQKPAVFFLVALIIVGCLPRLKSLHEMQIKVLPGDQFEQAFFIKKLAAHIKSLSQTSDVVLTNLRKQGTVSYYAERKIVGDIASVSSLDRFLAGPKLGGTVHFLMWRGPTVTDNEDRLYHRLRETRLTKFTLNGYHFMWFTLNSEGTTLTTS